MHFVDVLSTVVTDRIMVDAQTYLAWQHHFETLPYVTIYKEDSFFIFDLMSGLVLSVQKWLFWNVNIFFCLLLLYIPGDSLHKLYM